MNKIAVNTRCLSAPTTGVQRYTRELLLRLNQLIPVSPARPLHGIEGHLWEQLILPTKIAGDMLLWSPANTGPLRIQQQVVSIHDLSTIEHPEWFTPQFAQWYRFLLPRLAQCAQKVITVSTFTKNRMLALWDLPAEKIAVIPEGVDERFHPLENKNTTEICRELGIPTETYLLSLSSLEPRKNLVRLLRAWEIIQPKLPDELWLVLAGGKGKPGNFKEAGIDSIPSHVHLTGYVPEVALPALYSGAVGVIFPSLYEGFGLPAVEAMACGTPVIVSNNTSLPEVVGEAGVLVDPYSEEEIASAIQNIVSDAALREVLRQKGLECAGQYSWDKAASLTWDVLQKAVKECK